MRHEIDPKVHFKPNTKSINANIAGQTISKLDMSTRKVNPRKFLNTVLANFIIELTNKTAIENAVLDQETVQMLEYSYLITHKNSND